jgi:predicted nucleic acid-binding protein
MIEIIVDANTIMAALIGGVSREIFFDKRFSFITTEFTMKEIKKYIPEVAKRTEAREEIIYFALSLLPLRIYSPSFYANKIKEAEELIGEIDKKDVDILALTLFTRAPLWSQDRDFENIKGIKLLKTKDML